MKRFINIFEYALRGLYRRKARNLTLILVYTLVTGFFSSVVFLSDSLREESKAVLALQPELWLQKLAGGRLQPIPMDVADTVSTIRGVKQVFPRVWGYYYDSPTGSVFTIWGSESLQDLPYLQKSVFSTLNDSQIVCGNGFLESRYLVQGDYLSLITSKGKQKRFIISNSFSSVIDLLTYDLMIMSPNSAREMLGLDSAFATDLALQVNNPQEAETIGLKVNRMFTDIRVVSKQQLQRTYEALFSWRAGIFLYGGIIFMLSFLVVAWDRAAGLSIDERRELGILKGLGWSINDVLLLKLNEALAISLFSALSGILAAFIHIDLFNAFLIRPFFTGWSVLYPEFDLFVNVNFISIVLILSVSILPYLAAIIVPAWRGAIADPAEIMQESN